MRLFLFLFVFHTSTSIKCNVWNRFNLEDNCQSSIGCVAISMNGLVHKYSNGAPYYKFVNTAVAGCPESKAHLDVFEEMKLKKEISNLCEKAQLYGGCLRNLTILPYMHNKIWVRNQNHLLQMAYFNIKYDYCCCYNDFCNIDWIDYFKVS
ncbi:unnamed protein product [Auanema sp. JU1783]|nr:unnamed protein product [Auanema sp. JU1783]